MARVLPSVTDLRACETAVAGHDGTLVDADGTLFIKPCTMQEIRFYESALVSHQAFAEYMPEYLGTLTLSSDQSVTFEEQGAALIAEVKKEGSRSASPAKPKSRKIVTDRALVLNNASSGYKKPNILDVKLGVRLWADDAAQDKKTRFDKVTEETTHKNLGFSIAGMRTWKGEGQATELGVNEDGFKVYDKWYGRYDVKDENAAEPFQNFIFNESAGVDSELGKFIAQAFLTDLLRIQRVLEREESRMFSASLLFVFEGDGVALRHGMEEASKTPTFETKEVNGQLTPIGDDEENVEDSDDEESIDPKIYSVNMIDFAHAEWTPGMGPDENALLGVRSVINIMKKLAQ